MIVTLAEIAPLTHAAAGGPSRIERWEVGVLDDQPYEIVTAARDELDRRVLRLLADVLTPTTQPESASD